MTETTTPITLKVLRRFVDGDAVAIRGFATLEPAGGPGDKVFPPSHSVDERRPSAGAKYAFENRRIEGRDVRCVLLDSVQSQANRMEGALEGLWRNKRIDLPVIAVDFGEAAPDVGEVTSLTAPHRVADALLRDSLLEDTPFRFSTVGKSFTDATVRNATPLFRVCPTGLLFGLWDSTGPKGGLGAKFARAIVSEIVGIGALPGVKTESRIDPTGIVTKAANIYEAAEPQADGSPAWTYSVMEAKPVDPSKPPRSEEDSKAVVKWGKGDKAGKVSSINHSNVPPTIDEVAGGVTIDEARHTVVLSLAALRKVGFGEGDTEARTVLAALGLVAVLANERMGHDLRSRCFLVPRPGHALKLEAVLPDGTTQALSLGLDLAIALYEEACKALPPPLRFGTEPGRPLATLKPSPKLLHLVTKSRELAAAGADIDGEG